MTSEACQPIKHDRSKWDATFYAMAAEASKLSKDPDRKVGAILVSPDRRHISLGYNGFPTDVPDTVDHLADREFKLQHMVHAERNCIAQAPFNLTGATLYVTRFPCRECAEVIVLSGVARILAPAPNYQHERWGQSWFMARAHLAASGVEVSHYI